MESLSSLFNLAGSIGYWAAWGLTATTVAGLGYTAIFRGPRQLTPENGTARVITARKWPKFWEKDKIVAREGPEMYIKWGASKVSDIPLETFRVSVKRSGKDAALILKDKVKAQVDAEFFVRVDSSRKEGIVQAMEALGGEIDERKINEYCLPKFDAALRAAAAELEVEQIQSEREQFREAVKKGLDSLKDDGLILIDVALRQLDQSPLSDFDLNNYFDAQGYEKVVKTTEAARTKINDEKQNAETNISNRNKDEAKRRFAIEKERKEAELANSEEIARMEAATREQVAQHDATSRQKAEGARIAADREVELAEVKRAQDVAIAREEQQRVTEQARIARSEAIQLATAREKIAIHNISIEESEAAIAAAAKRAEAAMAEEGVTTARDVAVTERAKQIALIEARTLSEAALIEAGAKRDASIMAAEGVYASITKEMVATAEGKAALFDAVNRLDDKGKQHLLEMARVEITPEAIREAMKGVEKIGDMRVLSMGGTSGMFNGSSGADSRQLPLPGLAPGGGGIAGEVVNALVAMKMAGPVLDHMTSAFGGDTGLGKNVPGSGHITGAPAQVAANDADRATVGTKPLSGMAPG